MSTKTILRLKMKLRSPENKVVLQAIKQLRANGSLEDGSLAGADLRHVHLQGADLHSANLREVNLNMAHLQMVNLSHANLTGACLSKSNLYGANLNSTILEDANLVQANLQSTQNVSEKQLSQASRLWGAILPDGTLYDGRLNLPGDEAFAHMRHVNTADPQAAADFYRSCEEHWSHLGKTRDHSITTNTINQLIRKLRSSERLIVYQAIDELRARGCLADGSLKWVYLRFVQMEGADLSGANLQNTDMTMSHLQGVDLSGANLQGARLTKANMRCGLLASANLEGAKLVKANLQGALEVTEEQLAKASRLRLATMPDGTRYDGRYNLPGDLADARLLRVDVNDAHATAEFYAVSIEDYMSGKAWMLEHLPLLWTQLSEERKYIEMEADLCGLNGLDRESFK